MSVAARVGSIVGRVRSRRVPARCRLLPGLEIGPGVLGSDQLEESIEALELSLRSILVAVVCGLMEGIGDPRDLLHSSPEPSEPRGINGGLDLEE